jgi:hypothetical protein
MSVIYTDNDEPLRLRAGYREEEFRNSLFSNLKTAGGLVAKKLAEIYFVPDDHKKARSFIAAIICLYHFK